jgi:hypothetical protein
MNAIAMTIVKDQTAAMSPVESAFSSGVVAAEVPFAEVPLKPSADMLAEGARAGGVTVETAWKIYQAMLRFAR